MSKIIFTICLLTITLFGFGQNNIHSPSFTDNPLIYNPAYAGSTGELDASILHYRGSPSVRDIEDHFSLLSVSSPIGKGKWSIGGNMIYDKLDVFDFTSIDGIVAYHMNLKNDTKLSLGILSSVERHHSDINSWMIPGFEYVKDIAFVPQFGVGAIYQAKRGYISVSIPNMFYMPFVYEHVNGTEDENYTENDIYISAGLNTDVFNDKLQILPSITYQQISRAELWNSKTHNINIGASFIFNKIRLSSTFYTTITSITLDPDLVTYHALDVRLGVSLKNGLRISGKLEFPVGQLNGGLNGGIMLGYRVSKDTQNPYLGRRNFF